jgi:hypothetical protein
MQFDLPKVFTVSHLIAFGLGVGFTITIFIILMFIGI